MEYLDFDVRVTGNGGSDYTVAVLRSPAGECSSPMAFPYDASTLADALETVELALVRSAAGPNAPARTSAPAPVSVADFGRQLFQSLFAGDVQVALRRSQDAARSRGKGLRLRLRLEAADLAVLPWEFMFDPSEGDYVSLSSGTPLVRYLELDRPPDALTVRPPLRMLAVTASPADRPTLDVARERQRIDAATGRLREAGLLHVEWMAGSTWRDVQAALRRGTYHVLHFVGHGAFDEDAKEGVLVFTDEQGGSSPLAATAVGRLLADHESLRLVVLNACEGAKGSKDNLFSSIAALLVRRGVPAVIAMRYEISDPAAIEFSRALYEAVADGAPIDAAVSEGRKAVSLTASDTYEWGTPVLYMRAPDGVLFTIDGSTPSSLRASGIFKAADLVGAAAAPATASAGVSQGAATRTASAVADAPPARAAASAASAAGEPHPEATVATAPHKTADWKVLVRGLVSFVIGAFFPIFAEAIVFPDEASHFPPIVTAIVWLIATVACWVGLSKVGPLKSQ